MKYELTGKKTNKDSAKSAQEYELKGVSTSKIIWHLVKRHKFGLVTGYAIVLTALYIFPPLPDLLVSLVRG